MSHLEGRLADSAIYYQAWSTPAARATVIVSHGYAEHSGRYAHVAASLVLGGCNVWALDHRGHGQSEGERGDVVSWDSVVADLHGLVQLARESAPELPIFLFGHSLGGAIAIAYALEHQAELTGLSLSAPAIVLAPELAALAALPEIPPLPLADGVSSDPAVVQAYKDDPLVYLGAPPRNLLGVMGTVSTQTDRLAELSLPVQIMQGSSDGLIPREALQMVVAGVTSIDLEARLWPGLFHEIVNEPTKGAVVDSIVAWIAARSG